ncbi:hypothetical protein GN244_ATG07953 [Phytophthora infestans]|uniref:Uncharacterized protein n=1 Tax=Phytophthora infestans TaxID=4787 RepID=A0A833WKS4_PHYIN|nr:hypothetical protein GN244_ATG07953 [Phytophthora infestans]
MAKQGKRKEKEDQEQKAPPPKVAKTASVCEYCDKEFTTRGIPLHQKKCAKKQAHDKAEAKKTRSYKFCIVNEPIHEEILSFLSNQALTKMQMITGDRYQHCEPLLARYCCKCENDNPVISNKGLCRECETKRVYMYYPRAHHIDKHEAKDKYGVREKDLTNIHSTIPHSYDCVTLENYMIQLCGSKMEWIRYLAKRDMSKKKAQATRQQRAKEAEALLKSLAPGFAPYIWAIGFKKTDEELLRQCSQRFIALKEKLNERGLNLRASSTLCSDYVTSGGGNIEDVVRDTESAQSSSIQK